LPILGEYKPKEGKIMVLLIGPIVFLGAMGYLIAAYAKFRDQIEREKTFYQDLAEKLIFLYHYDPIP
jgi:hypothetical protein